MYQLGNLCPPHSNSSDQDKVTVFADTRCSRSSSGNIDNHCIALRSRVKTHFYRRTSGSGGLELVLVKPQMGQKGRPKLNARSFELSAGHVVVWNKRGREYGRASSPSNQTTVPKHG